MIEVDKQLPYSREAERAILGAILLDNVAFLQTELLSTEDFYLTQHQYIFRAMIALAEDKRPIDFVTLTDKLGMASSEKSGDAVYITSLTDGLPRVKNIEQYVRIVLGYSRRRKFVQLLATALEDGYADGIEIEDLINITSRQLAQIEVVRGKPLLVHVREITKEADKQIEHERTISEDRSIGYTSGLKPFDDFTTGFRRRELFVISGWTSDGKSSFMRQSVIANIFQNKKVAVFTHEVSAVRLILDIKAYMAEIPARNIRDSRRMDMYEYQAFKDANKLLDQTGLYLCDKPGMHIDQVRHSFLKGAKEEGIEIGYIDHGGLIRGSGKNETERQNDVWQGLWELADSGFPIVALVQMSRDEKKQKRRPRLQDLKQTSNIEQLAHAVAFVYQPENERSERLTHESEITIAKQRHGATGTLKVEFDTDKLCFKERRK